MKNRIVLAIIALLSMLLVAPAPLPEGPFINYIPYINRIVPATCPKLTVEWIINDAGPHYPCSNWAYIKFDPPGGCVETVQVFDADTGWEVPSNWINNYMASDQNFYVWFPISNPAITEPTWFNERFVAHFSNGCVSEVTKGFFAELPQAYCCNGNAYPRCQPP